jgi:predicted deacetylase
VELAVHGFYHSSNYECEQLSYEEFASEMNGFIADTGIFRFFVKGFKAPGWQISDGAYEWLKDNGWWVADQAYNDDRRPEGLPVYKIGENSVHTHTWNCVGNGIYELLPQLIEQVAEAKEFKFVSEVVQ